MNIGLINEALINKTMEDSNLEPYFSFIDDFSKSAYLICEFYVFNNIKKFNTKDSSKEILISFIKENLEILKSFDKKTILNERKKLDVYKNLPIQENILINAIDNIIQESIIKPKIKCDVNNIYKSYDIIFEELKKENNTINTDKIDNPINETVSVKEIDFIIKNSEKKFKEKYFDLLNEEEQKILKTVLNGSTKDKKILFENLKNKALSDIEKNKEEISEHIYESSISKINSMSTKNNIDLDESILDLIKIVY